MEKKEFINFGDPSKSIKRITWDEYYLNASISDRVYIPPVRKYLPKANIQK